MQEFEISVLLPSGEIEEVKVTSETTLYQIAKEYQSYYEDDIILGMINGKLKELNNEFDKDAEISFVTVKDRDGRKTYRRSVLFLLQKAVDVIYGESADLHVRHSLGEGYYCEIVQAGKDNLIHKVPIQQSDIDKLKKQMLLLCDRDIEIEKISMSTEAAKEMFARRGMHDKERLFHYRRSSRINIYRMDRVEDYFYGFMAPSTTMLRYFDIVPYENGFVILFPKKDSKVVEPLSTSNKLFHTLDDSREWSKMLGIGNVGALNDAISQGKGQDLILLQEALMEEKIGNIAQQIASDRKRKFILIAGPSSSGKTSFANRLSIQLTAKGLKPFPVSLDDYYADREVCPRNPDGSYDFECLEALDVAKFNEDMSRLLEGEEIELPSFNFKTGKREYKGKKIHLGPDNILVIEGIHGLNDKLTHTLPDDSKFKIYISALTQLNIDEHNPLPTTDTRLIRRIVRDARTRGTNAMETIAMWPSVRRGEEQNIFPYQEEADVMFNSALVYELAVLKVYAEPLLFGIPRECPEYLEANRLLKFLEYVLPMPAEGISKNSLLREFVGGSCFNV